MKIDGKIKLIHIIVSQTNAHCIKDEKNTTIIYRFYKYTRSM